MHSTTFSKIPQPRKRPPSVRPPPAIHKPQLSACDGSLLRSAASRPASTPAVDSPPPRMPHVARPHPAAASQEQITNLLSRARQLRASLLPSSLAEVDDATVDDVPYMRQIYGLQLSAVEEADWDADIDPLDRQYLEDVLSGKLEQGGVGEGAASSEITRAHDPFGFDLPPEFRDIARLLQ